MADLEQVKILKRGRTAWNQWSKIYLKTTPYLELADLRGVDLSGCILDGAHLQRANLCRANLHNASLTHARLNHADLVSADLSDAKLGGAQLNDVDLSNANLAGADLSYSNLINANLQGVRLLGANLSGANLSGATLGRAVLADSILNQASVDRVVFFQNVIAGCDLTEVKHLESVQHLGPSHISTSTIRLSSGAIQEVFLRGCGLQDWEIENAKLYRPGLRPDEFCDLLYRVTDLRVDPMMKFYSCFISYSHPDKLFVDQLYDALQAKGIRCWLDEHQLLPGDDIYEQVDRGIRLWDKMLLCCSRSALENSWWVDDEISKAYEKEQALRKLRGKKMLALIPLDLDGYVRRGEWKSGKASQIKSRLVADFTGWETTDNKFDRQFEKLVRALRADAGGREPPPEPKL